jgi:hypothetical protein
VNNFNDQSVHEREMGRATDQEPLPFPPIVASSCLGSNLILHCGIEWQVAKQMRFYRGGQSIVQPAEALQAEEPFVMTVD